LKAIYRLLICANSVALVREKTIPTERPPLSAKLVPTFADRGASVRLIPYGRYLGFLYWTKLVHSHKHFTRSLARSTSLEHSHKALH
jgi:hypothetical protein